MLAGDEVEDRKRAVMAAAESLIAEEGYETVRLRDIARRAGVSIGSIQHYFDTRDTLLLETVSAASLRRAREWAQLGAEYDDPTTRMRALLRGSVTDRERCAAWMTMCSAATRHPELVPHVATIYDSWRASLARTLRDGVEAAVFSPTQPDDQVLDTIMAVIDGLIVDAGLNIQPFDPERSGTLLEQVAGLLLQIDFTEVRRP
ncbi:TetR family transcriptional regulator C-terminal domain-containing protein [Microbacterium sp. LWH7-1.2]|uniref:TetR/AcrR family transcriptional regulator n=1 Tax=Microbacterium sp. LWH7-1.2 TaxID=3135257 RepID=UPI003139B528